MSNTTVLKTSARQQAEQQLRRLFKQGDYMGFDSCNEAIAAIKEASDWRERYDFSGDPALLAQLEKMGY